MDRGYSNGAPWCGDGGPCPHGQHTATVTYWHDALGMQVTTWYHGADGLERARRDAAEPSPYPRTLVVAGSGVEA